MGLEEDVFGSSSDEEGRSPGGDEGPVGHEGDGGTRPQSNAEALFGGISDDDDEDDEGGEGAPAQRRRHVGDEDDEEGAGGGGGGLNDVGLDSDEGDEGGQRGEAAFATGPPITIEAPLVPPFRSDELHVMRTSNVVNIDSRPFDPDVFREEEEPGFDPARAVHQSNMIRWRYKEDAHGQRVPESNAKMVKWSDGSMMLMLGDEYIDVAAQDITANQQYLFVRHKNQIIQGQARLGTRMMFQPTSLSSRSHLSLKAAVAQRHAKSDRTVRQFATVENPEKALEERGKSIEMRIKGREVLKNKRDKSMRRYGGSSSGFRGSGMPAGGGRLSADYLEADGDEEDADFDDEDDGRTATERALSGLGRRDWRDEAAEAEAERRILNAKRDTGGGRDAKRKRASARYSSEEESEEEEGGEESEEEEAGKARKKRVVISSDDDEDM